MKKITLLGILILFNFVLKGQSLQKNFPHKYIVCAEDLNFRDAPNTNSKIINKLENGEKLTAIDLFINDLYQFNKNENWIKVKRDQTNEVGYVYGKYIKPRNQVYLENEDCERIQKGFWYGIKTEGNKTIIKSITPSIITSLDNYNSIVSEDFYSDSSVEYNLMFCSDKKIEEGEIKNGHFSQNVLMCGDYISMFKSHDYEYIISCTGTTKLENGYLSSHNKQYFIIRRELTGKQKVPKTFEITKYLIKYGERFYIKFAGDIDNDGVPEIILSEGDNRFGVFYYFKGNENNEFEIQSLTYSYSKC